MKKGYYMALPVLLIAAMSTMGTVNRAFTNQDFPSLSGATAWLNTQTIKSEKKWKSFKRYPGMGIVRFNQIRSGRAIEGFSIGACAIWHSCNGCCPRAL
jgi:hypothetical protein